MAESIFLSRVKDGVATVEELEQFIAEERDVNTIDSYKNSALFYAVTHDNTELLNSLLSAQANVNYKNKDGWTPLMNAAAKNKVEAIQILALHNAHMNESSFDKETAVTIAALRGNKSALETLLQEGACKYQEAKQFGAIYLPALALSFYQGSHLEMAVFDTIEGLKEMSKNGMFVQSCLDYGFSALHLAALSGVLSFDKLLGKGLEVDPLTEEKRTPLMLAAQNGNIEAVKWFIEHGANIQLIDSYGVTSLHLAASSGHTRIVEYLLTEGADVNAMDSTGLTSLMFATYFDHEKTVEILLSGCANTLLGSKAGFTVLHIAAFQNKHSAIEQFVAKGIPVDSASENGRTALMYSVTEASIEALETLVSAGANVNFTDMNGWTALHYACIYGNVRIASFLLANGAQVNMAARKTQEIFEDELSLNSSAYPEVNKDLVGVQWTPLTLASVLCKMEVVKVLLSHGAGSDDKAEKALISCIGGAVLQKYGFNAEVDNGSYADIVSLLVGHGASVHSQTDDGSSMLMFASTHGLESIVVRLLELGADVFFRKEGSVTALGLSVGKGHENVVRILQDWTLKMRPQTSHREGLDEVDAGAIGPEPASEVVDQLQNTLRSIEHAMCHMEVTMRTQMSTCGDPAVANYTSALGYQLKNFGNFLTGQEAEFDPQLKELANNLGPEWKQLAITLGFNRSQVGQFESIPQPVSTQITDMLMRWKSTIVDSQERDRTLSRALKNSGRHDLAEKITHNEVPRPQEDILVSLSKKLSIEWTSVAVFLWVPRDMVEQIKMQHNRVEDQILEMLLIWAHGPMRTPWKTMLTEALKHLDRNDLVEEHVENYID